MEKCAIEVEDMITGNIEGKKVSVIGAARSGVAAARLLQTHGAKVFVSDSGSEEKLKGNLAGFKNFFHQFLLNAGEVKTGGGHA
jgi:UDP-N-acetylmuramoylalanine-D-glutamate ligase